MMVFVRFLGVALGTCHGKAFIACRGMHTVKGVSRQGTFRVSRHVVQGSVLGLFRFRFEVLGPRDVRSSSDG